jgi:tRNA threonylcarbamoyladenosine biosynthesis protein TsaB
MKILALDTATEGCSVALLVNGELLGRELELGRGHAERILPMVDEVLSQGGFGLHSLDAIAFGRGPGGFTGVRLAASVTQGLAFAAGLSVVPVSDLMAVAQRTFGLLRAGPAPCVAAAAAAQSTQAVSGGPFAQPMRVIVCNDARMREVYWACFEEADGLATLIGHEKVNRPEAVAIPAGWTSHLLASGRGFSAYPELRSRLEPHLAAVHDLLLPRAHEIAVLAAPIVQSGGGLPPDQALPVYVRDEVVQPGGNASEMSTTVS